MIGNSTFVTAGSTSSSRSLEYAIGDVWELSESSRRRKQLLGSSISALIISIEQFSF
eukprot:Awhi_evm1s4081